MDYYDEERENYSNLSKVAEAAVASGIKPTPSQVIVGLLFLILAFIVITWVLQISWNASVPHMFNGANRITFTAALGFLIVAMIIFPRA